MDIRLVIEGAVLMIAIAPGLVWLGSLQGKLDTLNVESITFEKEKAIKEIKSIVANQRIINESKVAPISSKLEIEGLSKKIDRTIASSSEMSDSIAFFESKLDTVKSNVEAHYKKETKVNNDINKLAKEINILKSKLNAIKVDKKSSILKESSVLKKSDIPIVSFFKTEEITTELQTCKRTLDKVVCTFLVTANKKNRDIRVYASHSYLVDNLGHKHTAIRINAGGKKADNWIENSFIKGIPVQHTLQFSEISSETSKISGLSISYQDSEAIFENISFSH